MGILNFFRRKKEPKEELSSLAVLNDTEPEKMKKEMASFFWKQMPHKKKLFLYTAVNSFIDPIVTTLRSHLTSIGALGAFALFSSAQPTLESIKASKNDEWFNEFELNINDAVIREIRQHPIVEQKAFNADEQYKRAQQLCKYGEDFIFSRMRSFSSCVGMGVAFGTLGLAALAGGPAALAVSAGAAAVSAGMTFFLAPWLGEKRRRITTSQETAINEQAAKITAKQKNQYRNGRMTALHPELGKKENASIKKEKKVYWGHSKKCITPFVMCGYNMVLRHW